MARPAPRVAPATALPGPRVAGARSLVGGLEQFDEVAGRVGEQNLPAARPGHHVAVKVQTSRAEPVDLGIQVVDNQVDTVAAGSVRVVRCSTRPGTGRPGQQEPQRAAYHVGEGGSRAHVHPEVEVGGVEVDGRFHVVDQVTDAGILLSASHGSNLPKPILALLPGVTKTSRTRAPVDPPSSRPARYRN